MKENPAPGAYFDSNNDLRSKGPTFGIGHKHYERVLIPKEQKPPQQTLARSTRYAIFRIVTDQRACHQEMIYAFILYNPTRHPITAYPIPIDERYQTNNETPGTSDFQTQHKIEADLHEREAQR